jgi:flagellar biosynthesis protein FlhF
MRIRRIEAATVAEGMRLLRDELGEDALILDTRTRPGAVAGQTRVEIVGAVDDAAIARSVETLARGPGDRFTDAQPSATTAAAGARAPLGGPPAPREASRALIAERLARFRAAVPAVPLGTTAMTAGTEALPCVPPAWERVGRRARRIAFVGPTGAGKTTTLAKVAARAHLEAGRRVSLVTIDTYRIGAVPQLASYAEILGVPLAVAHSPDEFARALDRPAEEDVVFIDTSGRSPLGPGIDALRSFVEAAEVDDVCLVLSVTTRPADSIRAATSYRRLGPTRLCLTKLDETDDHATIAEVGWATGLPLTWLGVGQGVPDDLEDAEPARVAALVGGGVAR